MTSIVFIAATIALALGYQLHFAMNSAPFYLRFAKPDELPWLMPIFWIGFNIAMFPASIVVKHRGGLIVMGAAGLLGAVAIAGPNSPAPQHADRRAVYRRSCVGLHADECDLGCARHRSTGAEGKVTGLVFSALALGTFARMAAVAGGLQKMPDYAPLLHWAPVACWSVAGAGLLVIAAARLQGGVHLKASAGE